MTDFITLASTPGGFAAMCRCGKPACFTHKQTVDPSRVILPPTATPITSSPNPNSSVRTCSALHDVQLGLAGGFK